MARPRSRGASLAALFAGVIAGGAATAAMVAGLIGLATDDPVRAGGPPGYADVTDQSGVDHVYDGEFQYFVGGGVSVFDCDGDWYPDLYIAGGSGAAGLYANRSARGGPIAFERATDPVTDLTAVTGAYPIDVDSDGILDLAVLRAGENVMLRGVGDCQFERANETWGIEGGDDWTVAFSATWEPGEALPTLAFGNYLEGADLDEGDVCAGHGLHRPEGDRYQPRFELSPGWCTLSILFSDWSRTGGRDLRMTNDRHYYRDGAEQLWRVRPGSTPVPYTAEEGWERMQIWGMGIASHDITGDGLPEVYLTSQGDNKLQTLAAGHARPDYTDIALSSGATAHRPFTGDVNRPSTAWHAEFGDVNNDGFADLFVTKGNVEAQSDFAMEDPNNLLLGSPGPVFTEAAGTAGLIDMARSRGGAVVDFDLDGLLDVLVVERRQPVRLWRNTGVAGGDTGNWLAIRLTQPAPNRDAVGAWVEVDVGGRTISHEVTVGGGHAGGELGWLHFGLGRVDAARVRVIWPDGETGEWARLHANTFWSVDRSDGVAVLPTPDSAGE